MGYVDRLDKLRSRGRDVGWGVEDELNDLGTLPSSTSTRENALAPEERPFGLGVRSAIGRAADIA